MTKAAALHGFFSDFGVPAYVNTSVPNVREVSMTYLTYSFVDNGYNGGMVFLVVQLWYKTESEREPNDKAREIYDRIGEGLLLPVDGGYIKLEHGSPWCVSSTADDDNSIKLRQININLTYLTM